MIRWLMILSVIVAIIFIIILDKKLDIPELNEWIKSIEPYDMLFAIFLIATTDGAWFLVMIVYYAFFVTKKRKEKTDDTKRT